MNPIVSLLKRFSGYSFKEKSLLISLGALLFIYGGYFAGVLSGEVGRSLAAMLGTLLGLVVALVVVHVVFHIVISLDDVEAAEDERDKAVARRAAVLGYNVLFAAVLVVVGRILVLGAWPERGPPDHVEVVNLLLAGLVASEAVYYGAQLFLYRRGFRD